jgi:hypothetical protein
MFEDEIISDDITEMKKRIQRDLKRLRRESLISESDGERKPKPVSDPSSLLSALFLSEIKITLQCHTQSFSLELLVPKAANLDKRDANLEEVAPIMIKEVTVI